MRIKKGNNFKIGVSTARNILDAGFSDSEQGWAYYSNGSLRHGSKAEGPMYGESYTTGDIIGVYVDLVKVRSIICVFSSFRGNFSSPRTSKYSVMLLICLLHIRNPLKAAAVFNLILSLSIQPVAASQKGNSLRYFSLTARTEIPSVDILASSSF